MGIIKTVWSQQQTILDVSGTNISAWSSQVDLESGGYSGGHLTVKVTFQEDATSELEVQARASLDGTNYDDTCFFRIYIGYEISPNQITFIVGNVVRFKLFVQSSGYQGEEPMSVLVKVKKWRYEAQV